MKLAQKSMQRIKNILKRDKEDFSPTLLSLIKSDIYELLSNYFELALNDIKISYYVDDDGKYNFKIDMQSNRIKKQNYLTS